MPDDSRLEIPVSSGASFGRSGRRQYRARAVVRGAVVLIVALLLLAWVGNWAFNQWAKVTETDARITTDQIAVSSRISGWVTELPVTEGDRIAVNELLVAIDARDAKLQLDELDARLLAIGSQRAQISAETAMVDAQTKSRREAANSRVTAARAAVAASRDQRDLARADFERIKSLTGTRVVSQQRLDQTRNALSLAVERYQVAVANLAAAQAAATCAGIRSASASTARAASPSISACRPSTPFPCPTTYPTSWARSSIRSATRPTRRSPSIWSARTY